MQISRPRSYITLDAALLAAQAAIAQGAQRGAAVVAAVVDAAGDLVVCLRADAAFSAAVGIARDKAYTAAVFGLSTDMLHDAVGGREVLRDGIAARPGVVLFGGGLPIRHAGAVIGAVGVSGGSEDDDRACAQAALTALEAASSGAEAS